MKQGYINSIYQKENTTLMSGFRKKEYYFIFPEV